MSPKFDLIAVISQRPTLHDVALKQLRSALQQHFPRLGIDPEVCVITRTTPEGNQRAETLFRNLQQAFLASKTPRWRSDSNTLVLNPEVQGATATPIDFDQLNIVVDTVALALNEDFQQALVDFWGKPAADGQSPWARLSDALKKDFVKAVTDSPTLDDNARDFLRPIGYFADQTQRNFMLHIDPAHDGDAIRACLPEQAVDGAVQRSTLPLLAATGVWGGREVFFSWKSPGAIARHASLNDLMASVDTAQSVGHPSTWTLREVDGDLFDALAQSILAAQLQQIADLDHAAAEDFADLERRTAVATDITRFLLPALPGMQRADQLPDWLRNASAVDRMDFSRRMIAWASAGAGKTFDEDIPPLLDYTHQQLQRQMLADHPEAADLLIADLQVVINKVAGAAIASGGQMIASGVVEPVRMSLAQFALENLSGEPAGALHIVHGKGSPVPDWFSADYLRLLVCQVDIGRRYPALLKRVLVTDPAESSRRQTLYVDQLRAQLPLQALEQKLRAGGLFCDSACQRVAALVQAPEDRPSGLRNTTLRPLGFRAAVGAPADLVANMFVISDRDMARGPVVLYRPFSPHALTEFTSWEALRAAIGEPGELQDEVLTWMDDHPRQVYANGGFEQPHIVRFGQGSEFAPLETPAPAQLASDEVVGDPLVTLYRANASALIELADRQSTSNAESRWALLKRGGWLALDSVMPFLRGPLGNALWLVQLMDQAQGALAVGSDASASERAESIGNMLLGVAMLLMHSALSDGHLPARRRIAPVARPKLAELLTASSKPVTQAAPAVQPDAAIMSVGPTLRLDSFWSRPDLNLTPAQRTALRSFEIQPGPELPEPSNAPGTQGLFDWNGGWYARVDNAVFNVQVGDDDVQIVDSQNLTRTGPRLVREGEVWRLDLALRLRGGGPKRSARQLALENAERLQRVNAEKLALLKRQSDLYARMVENDNRIDGMPADEHSQVIPLLETDIRSVIEIVDRKNELDQQLRPADRTGDKAYAKDLQGIARRICLLEGVLLSDMLVVAREDLARMREVSPEMTSENVGLYLGLFEKTLLLQEAGLHWSTVREGLWQRLRDVPKVGEDYWRAEALEFYNSRMFSLVDWRASRMWSSLELSFNAESILDTRKAVTLKRLLSDDPLHAALTSQAELEMPNDYTLDEQIGVLESSLREYDRASMVALAAFETEPEAVNTAHFQRFFDDLSAISDRAEHRLCELIRESEEPADTPAEYVPRVTQPRKRVIKTRGQRTLIGRLREGAEPLLGEVVEVKAAIGDRVIGSYHQHAEGEWVELEDQRRKLTSRDSIVPLPELMRRGRALLERVEPDIASAVRQSRRANEPEDMEDILVQKADKLAELMEKLKIHLDDPQAGEASARSLQVMLTDLQAGQSRLREQGRQLRIEMIKRQPPTASRISYLDRLHEVHIARVEGRKNMSGARRNDFVQEYAIRDKDHHLLWWAHFHYASEQAAADAFTAAHLKLPEQRLMGYKAMLKAAKDNKEVVNIYRSAIGKELAQRLFLHLAE